MSTRSVFYFALFFAGFLATAANAQIPGFSAGSDGSYGAIDVAPDDDVTIQLPDDGIIHATTVTVGTNATLRFSRNALNTPVYLLATGDVEIEGTIDVSGSPGGANLGGAGGPGGFDGGVPAIAVNPPGPGLGPGAGKGGLGQTSADTRAGSGAYADVASKPSCCVATPNDGQTYGSALLVPLVGGSGGGGVGPDTREGGSGGGGAILIASDTEVRLTGASTRGVFARGGSSQTGNAALRGGFGSGGAVRIVAPRIAGNGGIRVEGGNTGNICGSSCIMIAGHGRIRLDAIDLADQAFTMSPSAAVSIGAFMATFPDNLPALNIVEIAGQALAPGAAAPPVIILPFNTPNPQTVVVEASNFTGIVPIRVVVTPDSGDPIEVESDIDMGGSDTATLAVPIDLPQNVAVRINVFTREEAAQ